LLARIRAVLRRRARAQMPEAPPALVRMGDKTLDLEDRRLIGPDQQRLALHPREYDLLAAFAARPGRVLTRERLLDLAHPNGEEAFDRSIDVRIARIRRKLEADPANPRIIRTVRGAGYVFDPDGRRQA